MEHPLKRPLLLSTALHVIVLLVLMLLPSLRLPFERPLAITWVELPKGMSPDIGLGIKKSETLPRSTIEEQKQLPAQAPLAPEKKATAESKTAETKPAMTEPKKSAAKPKPSPTDKKIQNALKKIDQQLTQRAAPPESAQVDKTAEGYQYGTGTTPLRVSPTDPEYLKYQAMIRTKIINEWIIPPVYSEDPRLHFNAKLAVLMNLDGEVVETRWESRSGDAAFDASCLRAVRRASPFPKPPERLAWEAYNEGFLIECDPRLKQ